MQESSGDNKSNRVTAVANRLKMVQADFADAPPEQRRRFLGDEIERALASIVPAERAAFLAELQSRFPAWDQASGGAAAPISPSSGPATGGAPAPSASASATDQRELQDPSFLVARLCELAPKLSEQAKEALLARLRQAGAVTSTPDAPWSDEQSKQLRAKLAVGDQKKTDPGRVIELATVLAEFAANLHQLVGTAWRTLAPTTDVKHRPGSLQNAMGRFVAGDASMTRPQLAQEVERLRQLVASLIAGVGQVGRQFAHTYNARFAPAEIKSAAANEPGGLFAGAEKKCWLKYVELWDSRDEAVIEKEIRDTIVTFAETVMKGVGR